MFKLFDQLIMMITAVALISCRPNEIFQQAMVDDNGQNTMLQFKDILGIIVLFAGWIYIYDYLIRYKADRLVAFKTQLLSLLKATAVASLWLLLVSSAFSMKSGHTGNVLVFFLVVSLVGVLSRVFLRFILLRARKSGYNSRYLMIVGANAKACEVAAKIDRKPELGYINIGFVAENQSVLNQWQNYPDRDWKILGTLDHLREILAGERVDEIIVCLSGDTTLSEMAMIVQDARDLGIVVRLMPDLADLSLFEKLYVEEFDNECVVTLFREQMLGQLLLKRVIDASLSLLLLVIFMPLMAVIALAIKLTSPGPVLFIQDRVGMNQRRFSLYKFRSMAANAEDCRSSLLHLNERDGPVFKIDHDPRITPIGRILRKTSMDELPQLFNVLMGEMSLVGPRPPLPDEVARYEWLFRKRLSVKPGITCIWQISGRNEVSFCHWMEMDHEYISNWSLLLDLKILLKTIPAVLFSRGAS